jgi:hypothetical protein
MGTDSQVQPAGRADDRPPVAALGRETAPLALEAWWGERTPWVAQATLGFVLLGLLLRAARYLLNWPLWCDETMISANFLDRGYADLLRPLDYRQVGPLLWLAIELTSVKVLGFSEWTLRLFPFVCGMASVPLFRHVAGRVVGGVPLLLAVGIFAVSIWPIGYVAEVKPYASDLVVSLGILALAIEWWRAPGQTGWLWGLAALGPVAVALSLPSLFVLGGVGLVIAWPVWWSGRRVARLALGIYGAGVVTTFLAVLRFYKTAPQDHEYFHNAWARAFPPLGNPMRLLAWLADVHTGNMFAYPTGSTNGVSAGTFLLFAVGAAILLRKRPMLAGLCLAPFGVAFVAAAIHRYPYGVSARTTQYAAPIICLLAGLGGAAGLGRLTSVLGAVRALKAVAVGLVVLGLGQTGYDLAHPYRKATYDRDRSFARWFWTEFSRGGELVCARRDLGLVLDPVHWTKDQTDAYRCFQEIYSPRHRRREPPDLARVSEDWPLRVVFYNEIPQDYPRFAPWLAAMLTRYRLRSLTPYPVSSLERLRGETWDQLYVILEFVPNTTTAGPVAGPVGAPVLRR